MTPIGTIRFANGKSSKLLQNDSNAHTCSGLTLKAEAVARRVAAMVIFMVAVVTCFRKLTPPCVNPNRDLGPPLLSKHVTEPSTSAFCVHTLSTSWKQYQRSRKRFPEFIRQDSMSLSVGGQRSVLNFARGVKCRCDTRDRVAVFSQVYDVMFYIFSHRGGFASCMGRSL